MNAAPANSGAAPSAPASKEDRGLKMEDGQPAATPSAIRHPPSSADYFTRAIPDPVRILGLQLRPLSVGRYRLLHRFQVAFVAEGEASAGVSDLLLGILICAMRVDDFLQFAGSPQFHPDVRRWSRRVFPHPWLCWLPWFGPWWRRTRGFNVVEKIALFQNYIAEAQRIPRYTLKNNSPQTNTSHWSHSIEICLRSELGWTAEEINEAPLSKALADYFRHAESNGLVILLTDEDLQTADYNAGRVALAIAEWQARQKPVAQPRWTCDCGTEIYDRHDDCPHCGKRRPAAAAVPPSAILQPPSSP